MCVWSFLVLQTPRQARSVLKFNIFDASSSRASTLCWKKNILKETNTSRAPWLECFGWLDRLKCVRQNLTRNNIWQSTFLQILISGKCHNWVRVTRCLCSWQALCLNKSWAINFWHWKVGWVTYTVALAADGWWLDPQVQDKVLPSRLAPHQMAHGLHFGPNTTQPGKVRC